MDPNTRLSDPKVLERVFSAVSSARDRIPSGDANIALSRILNPVLAISFISGSNQRTYVVVSFYWPGHSADSYVRAIVRPAHSDTLLSQAIEILEENHYLSIKALKRLLKTKIGEFDESELARDLNEYLLNNDAKIAKVNAKEAGDHINANVYYSVAWEQGCSHNVTAVEKIARDLYGRLRTCWNVFGIVDPSVLENEHLDDIIYVNWSVGRPDWDGAFAGFKRWIENLCKCDRYGLGSEAAKKLYEDGMREWESYEQTHFAMIADKSRHLQLAKNYLVKAKELGSVEADEFCRQHSIK